MKACQDIGLFLNVTNTKYIHLNPSTNVQLSSLDETPIERVTDFKYLGSYTNSDYEMNIRIGQTWSSIHPLQKFWKAPITRETKTRVFKAAAETILLYGSEVWSLNVARTKKLDGTHTKMLRSVFDGSWQDHIPNRVLYGNLPLISEVVKRRRLALTGHVSRHDDPAGRLLFWTPEAKRRVGRPYITLKDLIEKDTGLSSNELLTAMRNREFWRKNFVNASPVPDWAG